MMLKTKLLLLMILLLLLGCSAHPGAGTWEAESENALKVAKLVVHFEGRAEVLNADGGEIYRCFWAAVESDVLEFQCTAASDPDTEKPYQFRVAELEATLFEGDKPITRFKRVSE